MWGTFFLVFSISLGVWALVSAATITRYPLQEETEEIPRRLSATLLPVGVQGLSDEDEVEASKRSSEARAVNGSTNNSTVPFLHSSTVDITGLALLRRVDFWILFFISFFITGSGLMWKNVVGSICESYSISDTTKDYLVITWSLTSTVARIVTGTASDWLRLSIPRPVWFIGAGSVVMMSHLLYIFIGENALWIVTIGTGAGYGTLWAIHPTILSLKYGMPHLSINLSIVGFAPALSGLLYTALGGPLDANHYQSLFIVSCIGLTLAMILSLYLSYTYQIVVLEASAKGSFKTTSNKENNYQAIQIHQIEKSKNDQTIDKR